MTLNDFNKMKRLNIALAAGALLLASSMTAHTSDGFQKNNWFVTGGVHTEALMNTDGYVTATGKVGAGIWINPWLGLKLEGVAGNTHLLEDSRGQVFGAQLTYMTHLYGAKEYRPFNLNAVLGMGFMHHKFGNILKKYSYMNILTGNLGVQAVYNFTPRWSVYLEPGLLIQPEYYNINDKDKVAPSFYVSLGVTYAIKDIFKNPRKHTPEVKEKPVSTVEINSMNRQINEMRKQISSLEDELKRSKVVDANKRVVLEPMAEMPAVNINFDMMGSTLNAAEMDKLNDVGIWMQDHPNSITIVPFADSVAQDEAIKKVKDARAEAIRKVLTEEFGIDGKRILTAEPEELGYVNKTGQYAMIVFMTE